MGKFNQLDELPLAQLTQEQLEIVRHAEAELNQQNQDLYLIAFKKNND